MYLQVDHSFAFEYDAFISESFLELRVQPKTTPQQVVASFELAVGPPTSVHRYRDWNDNLTHHFTITSGLRAAHRAIGLASTAPLGEQVQALGAYINERFEYRKIVTTYAATTEDFLKIGAGVCQDFAHLMLGLLRLRQIP